jgi:hypothetical protein
MMVALTPTNKDFIPSSGGGGATVAPQAAPQAQASTNSNVPTWAQS